MSAKSLRERFRQRRIEPSHSIELGASSANAYFTSKRIRQRPLRNTANKRQRVDGKTLKQHGDKNSEDQKEETEISGLQLPSHKQVLSELRAIDEHVNPPANRLERHFPVWKSELHAGFNLLFYGVGSKLKLLQEFASSSLNDGVVIQVHGYLPIVSLKYLTETLQTKILQIEVKPNLSLSQQCQYIAKTKLISRHVPQIYLLVHSIDGVALRNPEAQTCLSWLAKAPCIALLASMDHINGPTIWKEEDSLRFEWLSQNIDTFEPYTDEIELRLTKGAKTADATSNGVKFILQSLTPTDVATLQELARQQLAAVESVKKRGRKLRDKLAPYQSVYEACRKKLLHSTPLAMKNSVKCLEDHGLMKKSRIDAVEYLEIPLPESIIKKDILHIETDD